MLDQDTNTIIGIVSRSYVGYGNELFLADIGNFLNSPPVTEGHQPQLPLEWPFQFHEAYGINTEPTVRYISSKIGHGMIHGEGGAGKDISQFGFAFRNSMVGTSSVRINYFLYRLVCANGLMVPAASSMNRIFHSGSKDTFKKRLDDCYTEVHRKIDSLVELLRSLGTMRFHPAKFAEDNVASARIFDIIPGMKQTICDAEGVYLRYPKDSSESDKRRLRIEHDSKVIERIPNHFGGEHSKRVFDSKWRGNATMFDFLNAFTEYAKAPGRRPDNWTSKRKRAVWRGILRTINGNSKGESLPT